MPTAAGTVVRGDALAGNYAIDTTARWVGEFVSMKAGQEDATNPPTFGASLSGTIYTWRFPASSDVYLHAAWRVPNDYEEGTDIKPAVVWSPNGTNTGNCRWELTYSITNPGSAFPAETAVTRTDAASGTTDAPQISGFTDISGTGIERGAILEFTIARLGSDAGDTFTASANGHGVLFHYQRNATGSAEALE